MVTIQEFNYFYLEDYDSLQLGAEEWWRAGGRGAGTGGQGSTSCGQRSGIM